MANSVRVWINRLPSALLALAIPALASAQSPPATTPAPMVTAPATPDTSADAAIPTLGEVRALTPEDGPPVDLYRFRNPVTVEPNRFDQAYRLPPTVKEVSEGGGYVIMGLYYIVGATLKGVHKLTGGRDEIQQAIARPPPLTEAQLQRASAACPPGANGCGGAGSSDN